MTLYVALDVSLEKTAVCVMDAEGTLIIERVVPSDAAALAELMTALPERPERIGLEAGPLSEWLVRGLADAGFTAILMETRQVRAALSSMTVKTDRNDSARHGPSAAYGLVPASAREVDGCARAARAAVGQDDTRKTAARHREQRAGPAARLWLPPSRECCALGGRRAFAKRSPATQRCSRSSIHCSPPGRHYAINSPSWKSASGTQHGRIPSAID